MHPGPSTGFVLAVCIWLLCPKALKMHLQKDIITSILVMDSWIRFSCVDCLCVPKAPGGGGHSITKHTRGLARRSESKTPNYLSKNSNINKMLKSYPLNILKVQSDSSKISNLGQIFIFTENCTPNYRYESF